VPTFGLFKEQPAGRMGLPRCHIEGSARAVREYAMQAPPVCA